MTCDFTSQEFEMGIRRVLETTSRTIPAVVNQAALNVEGRAMNTTPITDKPGMISKLGGVVAVALMIRKSGKNKGRLVRGKKMSAPGAPLAALIINARLGKAGEKGLNGPAMKSAVNKFIGAKSRSVGFDRTGWIPGVRTLAASLSQPFILARMSGLAIIGQKKGRGVPAPAKAITAKATIENSVKTIVAYGSDALSRAMDDEGTSMKRHANEALSKMKL